jgi:hypothetical protein
MVAVLRTPCKTGTKQESVVAVKEVKPNLARKEQGRSGGADLAYQRKRRRSDPSAMLNHGITT